jgi:hypothetical protein
MNNVTGFRSTEFVWFTGVVEDRHDPVLLNRVKVRVFGYHTENKDKLPTADLPWAAVLMPTTSSGTSGVGDGTHGLVEGSWVMGFFRDGPDAQDPVIMGTIMGINDSGAEPTMGFNDPYGVFPREAGTDVGTRALGLDYERKAPVGVYEPDDAYAPEYPYNKVRLTESGHIIEFDDTPGAERINIQHRAGAFIELRPDNKMRTRSKERYDAMTQWVVTVTGDASINVGGNMSTTVQGNANLAVKGNSNIDVKGNSINRINGSSVTYTTGNTQLQTQGDINVKTLGDVRVDASGSLTVRSDGDQFYIAPNITLSAQDTITAVADHIFLTAHTSFGANGPKYSINATEEIYMDAPNLKGEVDNLDMSISELAIKADNISMSATSTIDLEADSEINLLTTTFNADASSEANITSATTNIDGDSTVNISGATTNVGSSGTTNIKSSTLNLNPGGTMSPMSPSSPGAEAPVLHTPDDLLERVDLPGVGFTDDEASPFLIEIEEADTDIQFPTPKYSVIKPDGTSSVSQQIDALRLTGRSGESNSRISGWSGTSLSATDTQIPETDSGTISSTGKIINDTPRVKYVNQYATRNKEIQPALESIIISAANSTGLDVEIFSGGMTPQRRTGSDRHLNGYAADVWLYKDGKRLTVNSPDLHAWVQAAKNAGATAIGAGIGYMGNVGVHLDISAGNTVPANSATYWGASGRSANAPSWLVKIMTS